MTYKLPLKMIVVCSLMLSGCADTVENTFYPSSTPVAAQPDIVSVKLAQAADKASRALDTIANIEQYRNPNIPRMNDSYQDLPPNLAQPITLRWSGPAEQIIGALAERAGYKIMVVGQIPEVPIVVNVDSYQQPLVHVLRNVGLQMGSRANLILNQQESFVEIRYAALDRSI